MSKKCPIEYTISLISGKWKIILIKELSKEPMRYGELLKEIPIISPKVLVQHLRELEKDKLIKREIFPEIPPRVEYFLSDKGRSMYNIFLELRKWGLAKDNEELAECNFCKKCQILL